MSKKKNKQQSAPVRWIAVPVTIGGKKVDQQTVDRMLVGCVKGGKTDV